MLDDAAIASFLDLAFDFFCQRQVKELVDVDRVIVSIGAALEPARIVDVQSRIARPARDRLLAIAQKSTLKMEVWLPAEVKDLIADELAKPAPIPQSVIDELVGSEKVRDEVRAMLSDTLSSFIKKATGGGDERESSPGAAVRSAFGFGARAMAAAGRGLLGGLGDQLEKTLQEKVRDFVDASVAVLQQRIAKKLASDDTAKALGKRRRKAFLSFLSKTEQEIAKQVAKAPQDVIDALVPVVVQHNLKRKEVRDAIRGEIEAALKELGDDTVGEVLDRLGQRAIVRDAVHAHLEPIAKAFVATPDFLAWFANAKA